MRTRSWYNVAVTPGGTWMVDYVHGDEAVRLKTERASSQEAGERAARTWIEDRKLYERRRAAAGSRIKRFTVPA